MSKLLEAAAREDKQRREDLDREDGRMFSEQELIAADIDYLNSQRERERQRIVLLHELELNELRCRGGM